MNFEFGSTSLVAQRLSMILLTMSLAVIVVNKADAASFDCARAKTLIERLICSNPALSKEDSRLGQVIRQRLELLPPDQREALLEYNREWLPFRLPSCGSDGHSPIPPADTTATVQCLITGYQEHIKSLQAACSIDPKLTLDDMAIDDRPHKTIPHDFTIIGGWRIYMVSWDVGAIRSYILPSKGLPQDKNTDANLLAPYKSVAQCTVRATDGTEWLANRAFDGSLFYVPANDTTIPITH